MSHPRICTSIKPGDVFGGYAAVERDLSYAGRKVKWVCRCECGSTRSVFGFSLSNGDSKSCGCRKLAAGKTKWSRMTEAEKSNWLAVCTHRSHGLSKHPLYSAWSDMKSRCLTPSHKWFPSYGGRGISVCTEWMLFTTFAKDMEPQWRKGLQLGRIDNNAGYCKSNCRWETSEQNQNNKSNNVFVETPVGKMTVSMAAKAYGLTRGCVAYRHSQSVSMTELVKPSQRSCQ